MKILLLTREYPPLIGGIGVMTKNLAEEWVRLGHHVDVVTGSYKTAPKFEIINGVRIYRVYTISKKEETNTVSAAAYIFFGLLKAIELQLRNHYDVINSCFAVMGGPIGVVISKIFKIKNVLMIIGGDIYEPTKKLSPHNNFILSRLVAWTIKNANEVVATSHDVKASAEKYYKISKNITVIPLGLKIPHFQPKTRSELDLKDDKTYIISVGRLAVRKNFGNLLKAFSKVNDPTVEVILVGDGPLKDELRNLAQGLGILARVHFVGAVSEEKKFQYLSAADIFVLPSWHEGFGIVNLEAMYCGLPIIASNAGGQIEFLKDGQNALLFQPSDVHGLEAALNRLLNDQELRKRFSEADEKTLESFYIEKIAQDYINIMK